MASQALTGTRGGWRSRWGMKPLLGLRERILALACVPCDSWPSPQPLPVNKTPPTVTLPHWCGQQLWLAPPARLPWLGGGLRVLGHGMAWQPSCCSSASGAFSEVRATVLQPIPADPYTDGTIHSWVKTGERERQERRRQMRLKSMSWFALSLTWWAVLTAAFQEVFVRALNTMLGALAHVAVQVPREAQVAFWVYWLQITNFILSNLYTFYFFWWYGIVPLNQPEITLVVKIIPPLSCF